MKNRILITGATGLLGKALIECSGGKDEIIGTYWGDYQAQNDAQVQYHKLNVSDTDGYEKLFKREKPAVVIHTASIGSPDYAEKYKEITWQINVEGTINLVSLCKNNGAKFVFISSNGIYDGDHAPYDENSVARPVNYYGRTKLEGENIAKASGLVYSIVRPILMYGWNHKFERNNIITLSLAKLSRGETVYAYEDVYCNPLYSVSCAQAIWQIIRLDKYGIYNIAGSDRVSVYEFIKQAAAVFDYDTGLVKPVRQGYFNELVPRPKDTSFNTEAMETALGVKPIALKAGLQLMKEEQNGAAG